MGRREGQRILINSGWKTEGCWRKEKTYDAASGRPRHRQDKRRREDKPERRTFETSSSVVIEEVPEGFEEHMSEMASSSRGTRSLPPPYTRDDKARKQFEAATKRKYNDLD